MDAGDGERAPASENEHAGGFMKAEDLERERQAQQKSKGEQEHTAAAASGTSSAVKNEPVASTSTAKFRSTKAPSINIDVAAAKEVLQAANDSYDADKARDSKGKASERPSTPPPDASKLAELQTSTGSASNGSRNLRNGGTASSAMERESRTSPLAMRNSPPPTPPARLSSSSNASRLPIKRRSPSSGGSSSPNPSDAGSSRPLEGAGSPPPAKRERLSPSAARRVPNRQKSNSPPLEDVPNSVSRAASLSRRASSSPGSNGETPSPPLLASDQAVNGMSSPPAMSTSSTLSNGSSSPPHTRQQPIPRRVKVYELLNSQWIDLGTGACTYHRGIARRNKRRLPDDSKEQEESKQNLPPASPPPTSGPLKIAGRAAEKPRPREPVPEYEEEIQLIETDETPLYDDDYTLQEGDEDAAWVRIVKEGRWKWDPAPTTPSNKKGKKRKKGPATPAKDESSKRAVKGRRREDVSDDASSSSGAELEEDETSESGGDDQDPPYDLVWSARIERPELSSLGLDFDPYAPHAGAEEGEEVIGRYRRQQDTLIVWKTTEGPEDHEMALSFAATAGCAEIWEFLRQVHERWDQLLFLDSKDDPRDDEVERAAFSFSSSSGLGLGLSSHASSMHQPILPSPSLTNLVETERIIKNISRSPVGRERLTNHVLKTGFINKLFPVFHEAEDLESISDLHMLALIMHSIMNLNDHGLWDYILAEDVFFQVMAILEYDPDFPTMKASYSAHLSDPSLFVEVVPIKDESVKTKIHQIYRMQYLKDVVLPRYLEDSAFTTINSFIYFHQLDVVQYLSTADYFWEELFDGIFPESQTNGTNGSLDPSEKQHDAIAFLQSYCQMVKQLQPQIRLAAFRSLVERGLPRVLSFGLTHLASDSHIRIAIVEIMMLVVDHDPSGVRGSILRENASGKKHTLLHVLIYGFRAEEELGIKAQLAEVIKILLASAHETPNPEAGTLARPRIEDPNGDRFLDYFYEHCVRSLFDPLVKTLQPVDKDETLSLSLSQTALYTHLCEILCFVVSQHSYRIKGFVFSTTITAKVAILLRSKAKHLRLAALRYFRVCIGKADDAYNRNLIRNDVFGALLELTAAEISANNLLSSACLELFECIRLNNVKVLLDHVMDKHAHAMNDLAGGFDVFRGFVARWEQNHEPPPDVSYADDSAYASASTSTDAIGPMPADKRDLSLDEENYFNADDDEPESPATVSSPVIDPFRIEEEPVLPSLSARKKADDEEEDMDDLLRRKRQKTGKAPQAQLSVGSRESSPKSNQVEQATDPELELARIREKRKREEDQISENEGGGLDALAKKSAPPAKPANKGPALATGKLKLLFGKKA